MYAVTGRGAAGEVVGGTPGAEGALGGKQVGEDESYGLKPMNCPGHCLLFKSQRRSYRDLPIRYADFSPLHRNEISGALSGLTRVRRFHQDDGHIFCTPEQVGGEIERTLAMIGMVYDTFKLGPYKLVLSTRPQGFMGEAKEWDRAEEQLRGALEGSGREWATNEGDGAFYGPKIDIILKDGEGRDHQTATVQLDFQLPRRFGLGYARGEGGEEEVPVIIHRAVLGSLERFMALLIEHYKGRWPLWLSPRQAIVLTIGQEENTVRFAKSVVEELSGRTSGKHKKGEKVERRSLSHENFMVDIDLSARSVSKKIAEAKAKHYNFICVVGSKEANEEKMAVDITGQANLEKTMDRIESITGRDDHKLRSVKLDATRLKGLMRWLTSEYY
jgi:threonyl-tRNA synthetase